MSEPKISMINFVGGMVSTNGYLLTVGKDKFLIDAPKGIHAHLTKLGIKVTALLLTHQHYDHVEDAALFSQQGVPIYAYQQYSPPLIMKELAERWGVTMNIAPFTVTHEVKGKDIISVGDSSICLMHIPGHSPDSLVFYFAGKQFLFCGDTLFQGSIGRTDLPFGEHETLLSGIKEHLFSLADDIEVFPGHGEATTIGEEKEHNPFLR